MLGIRAINERRGSAHDVRLGMPKPWMAVHAVPAVKPRRVPGCLQLLDLRFARTNGGADNEEVRNIALTKCKDETSLIKIPTLGQFVHGCE